MFWGQHACCVLLHVLRDCIHASGCLACHMSRWDFYWSVKMWEHCNWRTLPSIEEAFPDRNNHESSDLSIYRFAIFHRGIGVVSGIIPRCSAGGFGIEHGKNPSPFEELSRLWPGTHPIASFISKAWHSWSQLTRVESIIPSSLRSTSNEIR